MFRANITFGNGVRMGYGEVQKIFAAFASLNRKEAEDLLLAIHLDALDDEQSRKLIELKFRAREIAPIVMNLFGTHFCPIKTVTVNDVVYSINDVRKAQAMLSSMSVQKNSILYNWLQSVQEDFNLFIFEQEAQA